MQGWSHNSVGYLLGLEDPDEIKTALDRALYYA